MVTNMTKVAPKDGVKIQYGEQNKTATKLRLNILYVVQCMSSIKRYQGTKSETNGMVKKIEVATSSRVRELPVQSQ
ncbi:F-box/FBD/LRR-repeat protein-like [Dorcoceras hygrometricum]|uniref:F-box/FBD/LRR-repeat protein-like n=1 Tax=Dorcoceras hygrometricum TaxID=472368 RepID=A0A2Z7D7N7_9LAMI|nr:F-box/FBD/LRR-repeat protein-like [Dorcoceras hygrometricum]